jgi:hypothetical protein
MKYKLQFARLTLSPLWLGEKANVKISGLTSYRVIDMNGFLTLHSVEHI